MERGESLAKGRGRKRGTRHGILSCLTRVWKRIVIYKRARCERGERYIYTYGRYSYGYKLGSTRTTAAAALRSPRRKRSQKEGGYASGAFHAAAREHMQCRPPSGNEINSPSLQVATMPSTYACFMRHYTTRGNVKSEYASSRVYHLNVIAIIAAYVCDYDISVPCVGLLTPFTPPCIMYVLLRAFAATA
uniref:Uncharacterized protein n=1 Tax=Trichogramma kaykai TaxID=54128 RepID=A0ABD2W294_9HYME